MTKVFFHNASKLLILFSFLFLSGYFFSGPLKAQSATLTSGGDMDFSSGSMSYSIGQTAFSISEDIEGSSLEGVQQPYEISFLSSPVEPDDINCYPNPTQDNIVLSINNFSGDELLCHIFDLQGRLISSFNITDAITIINLETLASGVYLLAVRYKEERITSLKIIKY